MTITSMITGCGFRAAIPGISPIPMMPFLQSLTTKKDRMVKETDDFSRALEDVSAWV